MWINLTRAALKEPVSAQIFLAFGRQAQKVKRIAFLTAVALTASSCGMNATPSDEEYAVYLAIAQRDFKEFGVSTKLVPDCYLHHSDSNALVADSSLLNLFDLLGVDDAFIDLQQRQKRGCKLGRAFEQNSAISVFPEGELTKKMRHDWRGTLQDLASDPKQDGIVIFSRVGFSPDRKRAFVFRIGLRRFMINGESAVNISIWPTILTKTKSSWGVDFGAEPDEWRVLRSKKSDSERIEFIKEFRSNRGLISKD